MTVCGVPGLAVPGVFVPGLPFIPAVVRNAASHPAVTGQATGNTVTGAVHGSTVTQTTTSAPSVSGG